MRAPAFWWRASSPLAVLLRPVSFVYGSVAARRMRRRGQRADIPVICIGNFTAGGAGKTPTALAIAGLLRAMGETPAFLSRGYGGSLRGPVRVSDAHRAAEVGDEPILLSRFGPAVVARDRPGWREARGEPGGFGRRHGRRSAEPVLAKDLSIAVVDGATGLGNGLPLPSGPLRAPIAVQWGWVDAVLVVGEGAAGDRVATAASHQGLTLLRGRLVPDPASAARLRGQRVLAFTGIGRPEKFFETLEQAGAIVEEVRPFPDHHPYTEAEIAALQAQAKVHGLRLITTEKDAVRLSGFQARQVILTLPVHLQVDAPETLRALLAAALAKRRGGIE